MANGTSAAVTEATRLGEIGFPEFTVKLVTEVFDALIAANIRQQEAYIELIQNVSGTLQNYINNTKDDFGPEQVLQFLAAVLPALDANGQEDPTDPNGTKVAEGKNLTQEDADALNDALEVPKDADGNEVVANDNRIAQQGDLDAAAVQAILTAVANRLAANKYTLLREMVRLGMLRLIVDNGVIETRLTFTTRGSSLSQQASSRYSRRSFGFRARAKTGSFLSPWVSASASTRYNSLSVSTSNKLDRDVSGSSVQIFGRVQINFKTDFQPLTTP